MGKAGVNWQVTQKLDLGLNGRYAYDDYDATLGVQNGQSAGVNVDATYSYTENNSVSAYWSWQNGRGIYGAEGLLLLRHLRCQPAFGPTILRTTATRRPSYPAWWFTEWKTGNHR